VLARAYQDAVWRRTKLVQELRARLREYYPGFLAAFGADSGSGRGMSTTQLASSDARAVLALAPSPAEAATMSKARVETALRRGGRQRRITTLAASIVATLRIPQLRQEPLVEQAMRVETGQRGVSGAPRLRDHHQLSRSCRHQWRDCARRGR
jgi:hypothetical protein